MTIYRAAFISHAHADNKRCKRIAERLNKKGINVWIDLKNAQQGHDLGDTINNELELRTAFILMVTAASNKSHWVLQERGAYNALVNAPATHFHNGVERLIVSVQLSDEVPTLFKAFVWIDARKMTDKEIADKVVGALEIKDPPPPEPPKSSDATLSGAIAPTPTTATSTKATPSKSQKGGGQLWSILLLIFVFAIVLYLTYALVNLFAVH